MVSDDQSIKNEPEFTKLRFVSHDNSEIHFRVKTNTKLGKVIEKYYDRVTDTNMRFVFEGQEINHNDTPQSLEMKEDDVIDVFQKQGGRVAGIEYLTQGPLRPPPPKRKREGNIFDIYETINNLEQVQQRELAEIERKKAKDEMLFATKKRKYLEAKCKLKEDFAEEVVARNKFQEKIAKEEALLMKKQGAIRAQASRVEREAGRLEALVRGEEERRLELECPVCLEEMLPPAIIYGVSSSMSSLSPSLTPISVQCSQWGHPVCGGCLAGLTSCPSCRGPMGSSRAIGMEAVIKNVVTGP